MMAWIILVIAGLLEIGWAVGLKYTEGFTRLLPSIGTILAMVVSLALLGIAVRTLPLGTAYAVWTGIGTVGTVAVGIMDSRGTGLVRPFVLCVPDRCRYCRIETGYGAMTRVINSAPEP